MAPSAQASSSRCSVTYCRSWSRVRVTESPSVAGEDSSMPDGMGLPPLPTSTRRWPGVPASSSWKVCSMPASPAPSRPTKPMTCPPTVPAG